MIIYGRYMDDLIRDSIEHKIDYPNLCPWFSGSGICEGECCVLAI
jgi:hypothetical protein